MIILIVTCDSKEVKDETNIEKAILDESVLNSTQNKNPFVDSFSTDNDFLHNKYLEENEPNDIYIIKNSSYSDYEYFFEPLDSNEILIYNYGDFFYNDEEFKFLLSAKNTLTEDERTLGYWNVSYGGCQLSQDKKSGIFFLFLEKRERPLFMVDGHNGRVFYLMDVNLSARSTYDLDNLLIDFNNNGLFILIDLEKIKYIRSIIWNKSDGPWGEGGIYRIFRSLDPDYDFRLDYYQDHYILATAYYNVERNHLETVFDISDYELSYHFTKEREKILPKELGY